MVSYQYDSWGRQTSMTDSTQSKAGSRNPFRYREYFLDEETGLYYLNSRYYDPVVRRFVNSDNIDTIKDNTLVRVEKNIYLYCDNNPIMRRDDEGTFWNIVVGAAIGATIGMGMELVGQIVSGEKISIKNLLMSGIGGAASGGLAATGIGTFGQAIGNAAISGMSEMTNQYQASKEGSYTKINLKKVAGATFIGAISGVIGGKGARHKSTPYGKTISGIKTIKKFIKKSTYSSKTIAPYSRNFNNLKKFLKPIVTRKTTKSFFKATIFYQGVSRSKKIYKYWSKK